MYVVRMSSLIFADCFGFLLLFLFFLYFNNKKYIQRVNPYAQRFYDRADVEKGKNRKYFYVQIEACFRCPKIEIVAVENIDGNFDDDDDEVEKNVLA